MEEHDQARFRRLQLLTIIGPVIFVVVAEAVRYFYLRHVMSAAGVSLVAVLVTLVAAGIFSTYVFSVLWNMERERNAYKEAALALAERERIAREMHDGLAQDLAALNLKLYRLRDLATAGDLGATQAEVGEALQLLSHSYGEIRQTLYDLRAGHHLEEGFWHALAKQLEDFQRHTGITVVGPSGVVDPDEDPWDAAASVQILRIVQEVLANVRKHADATRLQVTVAESKGRVVLTIADDGRGFDPEAVRDGRHFGLTVMQERAELAGAEMTIRAQPGEGTRVSIAMRQREGGESHRKGKAFVGG